MLFNDKNGLIRSTKTGKVSSHVGCLTCESAAFGTKKLHVRHDRSK